MKAVVQVGYGSADVLEFKEIDRPVAADDDVLVHVHAASLAAGDYFGMRGVPFPIRMYVGFPKPKKDYVVGADLAGRVEAVGNNVTRFKPGDEVFGECSRACADYTCAEEDKLVPPAGRPIRGSPAPERQGWSCPHISGRARAAGQTAGSSARLLVVAVGVRLDNAAARKTDRLPCAHRAADGDHEVHASRCAWLHWCPETWRTKELGAGPLLAYGSRPSVPATWHTRRTTGAEHIRDSGRARRPSFSPRPCTRTHPCVVS